MPRYFELALADGTVEVMTVVDAPLVPDPVLTDDMGDAEREAAVAKVKAKRDALAVQYSPEACMAQWRSTGKTAASIREIDPADIPTDRTFRAAWSPGMTVDMGKARAIHMDRIRKARDAALPALDVEFTKAQGKKDAAKADEVEAKRQALRDLPSTFDLSVAKTPEELKALWPDELEERRGG